MHCGHWVASIIGSCEQCFYEHRCFESLSLLEGGVGKSVQSEMEEEQGNTILNYVLGRRCY